MEKVAEIKKKIEGVEKEKRKARKWETSTKSETKKKKQKKWILELRFAS